MLAYGVAVDGIDEYIKIGDSTTTQCVKKFVRAINFVFGDEYLRRPNAEDIERLLYVGQRRDFPGTLNDINVLDRSPIFHEVLEGKAPHVEFSVNGRSYNLGYYLTDDIYPNSDTFLKSIPTPEGPKHKLFAQKQEESIKDVEKAFGVLRARFAIVSGPLRTSCKNIIGDIMRACIIMHNMIIEDERDSNLHQFDYTDDEVNFNVFTPTISQNYLPTYEEYLRNHTMIRNRSKNNQLQADLIEEIWNRFRDEEHND